jgi:hypothetical protein
VVTMVENLAEGTMKFKFVGTPDEVEERVKKVEAMIPELEKMARLEFGDFVKSKISRHVKVVDYKA